MPRQEPATNGNRTARQDAAALALARGLTVKAAAKAAKIGERTLHTWLDTDAAFRKRVDELRAAMFTAAVGRLADTMTAATDCLKRLLKARAESVRLNAARVLLEQAARMRDHCELEARLRAVEEWQKANDRGGLP